MISNRKRLGLVLAATCALAWHTQASAQAQTAAPASPPAHRNLSLLSADGPRDLKKEEANKRLVLSFYDDLNTDRRVGLMADNYTQHNPMIKTGRDGVRAFFDEQMKLYPNAREEVHKIAADGDYVWVHLNIIPTPGERGFAVVDIFRVENGKLAEHWDVFQTIPESAANSNSMF